MTPEEIKDWMDRQTFYCPHLTARMTPAQCEANRARKPSKMAFLGDMVFVRPKQCEACNDYKQLTATIGQKQEDTTMAKRGNCVVCGRGPYALTGKGLCAACQKEYLDGRLKIYANGEFRWVGAVPKYAQVVEDHHVVRMDEMIETQSTEISSLRNCKLSKTHKDKLTIGGLTLVRRDNTQRRISNPPTLTVRHASNQQAVLFSINSTAMAQWFDGIKFVDVYEDRKGKLLAFNLLETPTDEKSLPVRCPKRNERVISATAIARDMDIVPGKYAIRESEDMAGVLLVDFSEVAA